MRAGSFQCIWFICLGQRHQTPVIQWWQSQAAAVGSVVPLPSSSPSSSSSASSLSSTSASDDLQSRKSSSASCQAKGAERCANDSCFSCTIATDADNLPLLTAVTPMYIIDATTTTTTTTATTTATTIANLIAASASALTS